MTIQEFIKWFDNESRYLVIDCDSYGEYHQETLTLEDAYNQYKNVENTMFEDKEPEREHKDYQVIA